MHRLTIFKDDHSFDERTDRMLRDVRRKMDEDLQRFGFGRTQKKLLSTVNWDSDDDEDDAVAKLMSRNFFKLKPQTSAFSALQDGGGNGTSRKLSSPPQTDEFGSRESLETYKSAEGQPFSVSFDVKDYDAEDISVTAEDDSLVVQAKHQTVIDGAVSIKEFSRKVKVPKDVDPEKLTSTLTSDGILTVEAPTLPVYKETSGSATPPPAVSPASSCSSGNRFSDGDGVPVDFRCVDSSNSFAGIPLDTPVFSSDGNGRRKMELILEVGKPYTPEDVVVKLEGKRLIVQATHEQKWQGKSSKISMQRDFDLSEDIDSTSVEALLKSNGRLMITANVEKINKCKIVTS